MHQVGSYSKAGETLLSNDILNFWLSKLVVCEQYIPKVVPDNQKDFRLDNEWMINSY